jgi:uncharacterized protein
MPAQVGKALKICHDQTSRSPSESIQFMSERTIAVISDTHGLLRPELLDDLEDFDQIIHAGDVGKAEILEKLRSIAPLTVVRGNVDHGPVLRDLPEAEVLLVDEVTIYVLHRLEDLDLDPASAGFQVVIYGHTHEPSIEFQNGVLYLNPGSIGPRRFSLPVSYAILTIEGSDIDTELVELPL